MQEAIRTEPITREQAKTIIDLEEGQFGDVKAKELGLQGFSKIISAFANSDGGDFYVGIAEVAPDKHREWAGFAVEEDANGSIQSLEGLFPLGTDYQYEFLRADGLPGLILHLQVSKTQGIVNASNGVPYVRRGAQSLPVAGPEALRRLEYAKGVVSFETELTNVPKEVVTESEVAQRFVQQVVPTATPEAWLRKQVLLRDDRPTVAGTLLFADEPQAAIPKHAGIKLYRYKTSNAEGTRATLAADPDTIEGCLYEQIKAAVEQTTSMIEGISIMGDSGLETVKYPPEALHEIITNAVLHRDYSIADDVHIRVFDNRIEIQSPGRLPGHVTVKNILDERFARNGAVVRILNKFPDPPNKDVGEGLNTAFEAMTRLRLKRPVVAELDNAVLVLIKHEPLASAEEAVMDFLEAHETIKNKQARAVAHVAADYQMKAIFGRMVDKGMIEQVLGTRTASTAYRRKPTLEPATRSDDGGATQAELRLE